MEAGLTSRENGRLHAVPEIYKYGATAMHICALFIISCDFVVDFIADNDSCFSFSYPPCPMGVIADFCRSCFAPRTGSYASKRSDGRTSQNNYIIRSLLHA